MRKMKKIILAVVLLALVATALVACATKIDWYDADGSLLYREKLSKDDTEIPQKPLPEDNDQWDYTEWKEITSDEKQIIFQAERIALNKYIWLDADGTELNSVLQSADAKVPSFELPKDNSSWDYTGWKERTEGNVTTYTAERVAVEAVIWTDVDGTVLYTVYIKPGDSIPERYLPNDTEDWHYTGWKKTTAADGGVKFVAERVKKEKIVYLDVDGSLLYTDGKAPDEAFELRVLPKDSEKWLYSSWEEVTEAGGDRTFRATGEVNPDYFKANVFQIVVYDIDGNAIQSGTGFVFNKNGWFITNHHVLDGGVSAKAFFEIEDYAEGSSYTVLDIDRGYSSNVDRDIFIGRISSYSKISSKYKNIPMVRNYAVGDVTYSVGYPKSSVKMEIHKGEVVSEYDKDFNNLYEKLYSGITYIPSSSYVHHGSSGGILVNEKLEVIGMTSRGLFDKKDNFVIGASIKVFNFMSLTNGVSTSREKSFLQVLYPEEGVTLELFLNAGKHKNCTGLYKNSAGYYYQLVWEKSELNMEEAWVLQVYSNGNVIGVLTRAFYEEGDILTSTLMGNCRTSIDEFSYLYTYNWGDGGSMAMASEDITYSSTVDKTLPKYESSSESVTISSDNIYYARKRFNETYVWLRDLLKELGA